jgi:protein MpaA
MKLLKFYLVFLLLTAVLAVSGCQPGRDRYAPFITTPQVYPPDITDVIESQSEILGYSLQNRPIELLTLGSGPDTVLMIASIHGNEDAMPVANPDGRALRTRGNAAGIDLNRNFPAENRINNAVNGFAGLTEPESSILYDLILARRPARIVTIHQPLYCLDYDGPGEQLARAMAVDCPLPVNKLGSRPGSLGSFAGTEHNTNSGPSTARRL